MGRQIIGLTGYARSGKDTVAKLLEPYGFVRVALADGVREMALAIDPWIDAPSASDMPEEICRLSELVDQIGWEHAKGFTEVRRLLQVIGTEAVRNIVGPDTWIKIAGKKVSDALAQDKDVVITDVRFPNEANWIHEIGGEIWRIMRPGVSRANNHASEFGIDKLGWDRVINNDGPIDDLDEAVSFAMGLKIASSA